MASRKTQWERTKEARAALALVYPQLFDLASPKPFKIRIFLDLRKQFPDLKPYTLKCLLVWLTRRRTYLRACIEGAPRYGLEGVAGAVTAKEAAYAVKQYAIRELKEIERAARLAA